MQRLYVGKADRPNPPVRLPDGSDLPDGRMTGEVREQIFILAVVHNDNRMTRFPKHFRIHIGVADTDDR